MQPCPVVTATSPRPRHLARPPFPPLTYPRSPRQGQDPGCWPSESALDLGQPTSQPRSTAWAHPGSPPPAHAPPPPTPPVHLNTFRSGLCPPDTSCKQEAASRPSTGGSQTPPAPRGEGGGLGRGPRGVLSGRVRAGPPVMWEDLSEEVPGSDGAARIRAGTWPPTAARE